MGTADLMQRFGFGPDFIAFFCVFHPANGEDFLARA